MHALRGRLKLHTLECYNNMRWKVCLHRILTRLPSNLRPTTRECVHFITRDYFRDKDSGYAIRYAMALNFIELELWAIEVLHST